VTRGADAYHNGNYRKLKGFLYLLSHLPATTQSVFPPKNFYVELAVYAGNAFALLTAGEIVAIVLNHAQTWRRDGSRILAALRLSERRLDQS